MPSELIEPLLVMIAPAGYGGIYDPGEWPAFPVKGIAKAHDLVDEWRADRQKETEGNHDHE